MDLRIREAEASDYDALCALFDEVDSLHRTHLPHIFQEPDGPARDKALILGLLQDEAVGLFVAEVDHRLVGLIFVFVREPPEIPILVPRRYALIDNIVVKEVFRRSGIGRALMEKAQRWALAQGADSVELSVWEFNHGAIAFYQTLGYETCSRRMSKRLRKAGSTAEP
jgi:ribosomal protein S18 acetylase RimI-like enzyme